MSLSFETMTACIPLFSDLFRERANHVVSFVAREIDHWNVQGLRKA